MKKLTTEDFIQRAKEVHRDKYDYSKINYQSLKTKITIICPKHGEFEQLPLVHLGGGGCQKCSMCYPRNTEEFIKKAKEVHGDKYDYSKSICINTHSKIIIICPQHGEFEQSYLHHIHNKHNCPQCGIIERIKKRRLTKEEFIRRAKEIHGDKYDYSKVDYENIKTRVTIICPEHGEFQQESSNHLQGNGCLVCGFKSMKDILSLNTGDFIQRAKEIHGDKYDYSKYEYVNNHTKGVIICPKHGEFKQSMTIHIHKRCGCPKCNHHISKKEQMLANTIQELGFTIEQSKKGILSNNQEIDIWIPEKNIGFEFDGLFWHSTFNTDLRSKYSIRDKQNECDKIGIRLINIFEDEWDFKEDIVKSRIKQILGLTKNRIYARQTIVQEIDSKTSNKFYDENHIQGKCGGNKTIHVGLTQNGILVSLMSFCKPRLCLGDHKKESSIEGNWELLRFVNLKELSVVGGASKCLKYFIRTYKPSYIFSYSDRRWSRGNLYQQIGFKWDSKSNPSYGYIVDGRRIGRFSFRKTACVEKGLGTMDMTEREMTENAGFYRVYDAGTDKWVMDLK